MFHCSAAEGQRFQQEVIRISEIIQNLGNNPFRESTDLKQKSDSKLMFFLIKFTIINYN